MIRNSPARCVCRGNKRQTDLILIAGSRAIRYIPLRCGAHLFGKASQITLVLRLNQAEINSVNKQIVLGVCTLGELLVGAARRGRVRQAGLGATL